MKALLFAALLLISGRAYAVDQALIDAARKEGSVVWYSTLIVNQIVRPMSAAFEAKYPGIKVEYSRASSSDVALKIANEARARRVQSDLFDGSNTVFLLRDPRLVASYTPEAAKDWPAELKSKDGTWTGMNLFYWTAAYNTNLVKPTEAPKTYADLLDPKWKGKIAVLDMTRSGTGSNQAAMMEGQFGQAFVDKLLVDQQPVVSTSRRQLTDWTARGTYPISIGAEDGEIERLQAQGLPVDTIYSLDDMPGSVSGGNVLSLMDKAPNPNAARVFVNWMASKEGVEIYGRALKMVPARSDIAAEKFMPAEAIPKQDVKYFDTYDWNFTVTTKGDVRRRMKDLSKAQ